MVNILNSKMLSHQSGLAIGILDAHPIPTWLVDKTDCTIIFANKASGLCYGFTAKEFENFNLLNLFVEESRIRFFDKINFTAEIENVNGDYQHCTKDGKIIVVDLYASSVSIDETSYYQISVVDQTQKLLFINHFEEERNRYRTYIEQSSEGIFCQEFKVPFYIHDSIEHYIEHCQKASYISHCNDSMAQMYGYEVAEEMKGILSRNLLDYSNEANFQNLKTFISNGFRISNTESQEKDRYGNSKYFLNNAIGIVEDGYLKRIWGTQRDVTEKKKIEEKIRLLANLVEETSDLLTAADLDFNAITWNKAAEKIFGLTAEQVIGTTPGKLIDINYMNTTREKVRKIIATQGEWRGELNFKRPTDNKFITLFSNFKVLKDESGEPIGHLIAGTDITERKEAELRLKESESRFRDVADSAPVMIWIADADNHTTYVNKIWEDFTGVSAEEFNFLGWHTLVHHDDIEMAFKEYYDAFENREVFNQIYRVRHHSGDYRWLLDTCIPRFLEDGTFIGYIGSSVDVTKQKKTEEELRYNATILENVSDIIVTTDLDMKVRGWNKVAEQYYGIPESYALRKRIDHLVQFEYFGTSQIEAAIELQKKGIWNGEVAFQDKKGNKNYFLQTVKFVYDENGVKSGFISVGRNITDRKQIEQQLLKSEQFYRTLIADSLGGTALVNENGIITYVSPSVKHILGFDSDELKGKTAFEFIHPDDFARAFQSFEKVVENPHSKFIVIRLIKKDGGWVWCMVRAHNLLHHPNINSLVLYFHDDTLRKQAEDALKESETTFRNLIADLQTGVVLLDKKGNTLLCNKSFAEIFRVTTETIQNHNIQELTRDPIHDDGKSFHPGERPANIAIESKKPSTSVVMGCFTPLRTGRIWLLVNCTPVLDENDEIIHLVCSVQEITERKKMEEEMVAKQINHQKQLTQASIDGQENERREIGKELHDSIGQQLTTIKLLLDLAKTSAADEQTNKMLTNALKSVTNVINEVRAMSRSLIPSTLNDLGLIESIYELIDSMTRTETLEIEFMHASFKEFILKENQKLTLFRIIQEQLNNIMKHAAAKKAVIQLTRSGTNVDLKISDDGKGFDFKKMRKGLGFINMKNRAELFGGRVQIVSQPGKGCQLHVNFPLK